VAYAHTVNLAGECNARVTEPAQRDEFVDHVARRVPVGLGNRRFCGVTAIREARARPGQCFKLRRDGRKTCQLPWSRPTRMLCSRAGHCAACDTRDRLSWHHWRDLNAFAVYPTTRYLPSRVRAFVDLVTQSSDADAPYRDV
jgi:hypothetical protein